MALLYAHVNFTSDTIIPISAVLGVIEKEFIAIGVYNNWSNAPTF